MAITLSTTFTDNLLNHSGVSVADAIGSGTLVVYGGTSPGPTPPAGPNEAATGTAIATFTFGLNTAQGAAATGSMQLNFSSQTVTAAAAGVVTYFRILNSGGTALMQGTVNTSGADFNLSSTTIASGDNVSITGTPTISWTVN
jgi:hypothetical protein